MGEGFETVQLIKEVGECLADEHTQPEWREAYAIIMQGLAKLRGLEKQSEIE